MKIIRSFLILALPVLVFSGLHANRSSEVEAVIARMNDLGSFRAGVNITSGQSFWSGTLSYDSGRMHLALNDKRIITADKKHLYVFDPNSKVVGKQPLVGQTAGLEWLLKGYLIRVRGKSATLTAETGAARYREVQIFWNDDKILHKMSIRPKNSENWTTIVINDLQQVGGFPDSLFTYRPPRGVRVILNPLSSN